MVAVLGPSGSGKTTLLRCIAVEAPTGGEIWKRVELLSSGERGILVPPEQRHFGMMFQSYAVWPHMTVFGNVAYPLGTRRLPKAEIEERVSASSASWGSRTSAMSTRERERRPAAARGARPLPRQGPEGDPFR